MMLVEACQQSLDDKWDVKRTPGECPGAEISFKVLNTLLSTVRSLGVSLDVWKSADPKKKYEWTSLMGGEKRKLLKKLPEQFHKILPQDKAPAVQKLWNEFRELLEMINSPDPIGEDINHIEVKARDWGKLMVSMSGSGAGYLAETIITPYMHILVFHVPTMMRIHGSLKNFSGQGVEKKNDDIRRFFHRKINRWDASTSVLLVEKRQEDLGGYERQPRKYMKKNEAFWCNGGKQQIARDYPRISTQTTQPRED